AARDLSDQCGSPDNNPFVAFPIYNPHTQYTLTVTVSGDLMIIGQSSFLVDSSTAAFDAFNRHLENVTILSTGWNYGPNGEPPVGMPPLDCSGDPPPPPPEKPIVSVVGLGMPGEIKESVFRDPANAKFQFKLENGPFDHDVTVQFKRIGV